MNEKLKSIAMPLVVIFVGLTIGGGVLLKANAPTEIDSGQSSRLLTFNAPGMFCLGCSASIEGYLGEVEGIQSVSANLGTKLVEVVYDSSVISKDDILANQILDSYGREFLNDEPYSNENQLKTPSTTNLPQSLALKLQDASAKVSKLENKEEYQVFFDQINEAITNTDYSLAESILDNLLTQL